MKKNQERRLNRKNAKKIEAGEAPMPMPATAGTPDAPGREVSLNLIFSHEWN
jgi:hypothetical protein